ncbi:DegT/DnrJ/EryC1/StrS family aminotransferase [Halobacillus karajensis]|uniref:Pyridoxal phosphate-dependent aminotransferase EpsN n=1 Tax=Halobacillus karajensis TaxID=195088 RepID=A0A059NYA4_9BACI|nr:aminotransferase class I/II-fold pyridoxal phosphate-dependent enzyme [Halobacillus karajensis]CDQ18954.1 Putative pyridoxal phosphate-dependent aminotransferase EpsN [Halobacillus karajensis]CDQ22972.1 Putative pyridoxal phosphate-dependent aminotransferase EpsN [Halobacillus karajensis]CDQ26455.1 Putative pyridoxal phosphate-dependent aminotransferase EpsN [Halobacillus karajensis]
MSNDQRIFLSSPHMSGNEQKYIKEAFDLNWIAPLGNNVDGLEKQLAQYNSVNGAAVFTSGTAAIHLALKLLNVTKGDKVFCSSLTFVASANPILYEDATPILIDSEPDTWNMSPKALKRALVEAKNEGHLPKAVIVVNLYGQSAKMDELLEICETFNVPIIEDAAESLGSTYKGQKSGTFGKFGVFSFNGNKIITTSGGGALVSNDTDALEKARFLSTQARDKAIHYQHSQVGYNYRMSNIVAGVGRGQMEVLDERITQRRSVFDRYYQALNGIEGIAFQPELDNSFSNRWLTALTIDVEATGVSKEEIIKELGEHNIEARPAWKPMHLQPLFKGVKYYSHDENISISDYLFEYGLCLPSGSNMSGVDQEKVIYHILKTLEKGKSNVLLHT